ncbi:quinone oxidoreductase family protein [Micromonospora parathelypteridis]|uniref:NADPH:quinone reductase-like Zn-dependent oxidoreductase n=1 Tax=Micromonospora parathelypteridis TaxID=1839617 RepID=A0A840VRT8_9ACTN|nr:zinc-binding alcohol dehydrogenase family protein [Micromonospora parathelypteridis]MBB5475758.1 NADPH:quinone reductase-like Zn-dependent oxidoreductase [Micromonospora parathelypteridis]GGO26698.1 NADPH:quinone reductase [Micromonospora parathelypteridis]
MIRAAQLSACGTAPTIVERPARVPADGQVAVTVEAVPITPLDVLCASGTSYFGTPSIPYVPGVQGVGRVADGTAVWFGTSAGMKPGVDGSMATTVAVPAVDVVALPPGVPLTLIAALGLSAVAAHAALTHAGGLAVGEQVIVLGAGGVVGQAAVQLALLGGARRVVAVARSAAARARAEELGAAVAIPLLPDDDVTSMADRLRHVCDGPVDLVLDPVFGVPAAAALRVLRPTGRLVNLGSAAGATAPIESAVLRSGSLRMIGYTNNGLSTEQRAAALGVVAEHAAAGRLTVDHEIVPFDSVADAWARQDAGTTAGRIVLTL